MSTGYYLVLPWKVWPSSDRLRVIAQLTLAIFLVGRPEGTCLYKSSHAASGFDDARAFKLQVDLGDGVGVNAEVYGQLPHRGELITHD